MTVTIQAASSVKKFLGNLESGGLSGNRMKQFVWLTQICGLLVLGSSRFILVDLPLKQKTSSNLHLKLLFAPDQVGKPVRWFRNYWRNRTGLVGSSLEQLEKIGSLLSYYIGYVHSIGFAFLAYPRLYPPPDL